jgi:protein SCO1/2
MLRRTSLWLLFLGLLFAAFAEQSLPPQLEGVGVEEKLGARIDLSLQFIAENGYPVPLSRFFNQGRPVLLNLVYYSCPMLCNLVLNGQTQALREVPWVTGHDFEIVTISINPGDTFALAQRKKQAYAESYGKSMAGWHFLTDYQGNARKLAEQVGFRYRWDEASQQYAHLAAIMFLTPDGKISRYLYGVKFRPRDMRLALTEASQGKLAPTVDRLLLYCFQYDPSSRSYVLFAKNLMRLGGAATVLIFGAVLLSLWRQDLARARTQQEVRL